MVPHSVFDRLGSFKSTDKVQSSQIVKFSNIPGRSVVTDESDEYALYFTSDFVFLDSTEKCLTIFSKVVSFSYLDQLSLYKQRLTRRNHCSQPI